MNHSVNLALAQLAETHMPLSAYFGESYHTMFDTPIAEKQCASRAYVAGLPPGGLDLVVVHAAQETPEMRVLVAMNDPAQNTATGEPQMSRQRQAELDMLLSPEFESVRDSGTVRLLTYTDLMARQGRAGMRRP